MSERPTDLGLWRRAAAGQAAAFGALYERHARPVYNHCWEQLNDQAAYRVQGTRILPSTRADPLVQRIEGKPLLELERLIAEAQAALERGDLEPTPPGRGGG
jgi:hypothetical protein